MRNASSFSDFPKILSMRLKKCDLKLPTILFGFVACTSTPFFCDKLFKTAVYMYEWGLMLIDSAIKLSNAMVQ